MPLSKTERTIGTIITAFAVLLFSLYLFVSTVGLRNELAFLVFLGVITIATTVSAIAVTRSYRKDANLAAVDYLNVGVQRYLLGIFMIFYGLPKLFGTFFDYQLFALDSKVKDISEFELAWYFYGKNRWQELFAGIMELVPGLLLLGRRTYYVGALVLLPVTGQVFVLNFFFKIGGVTLPAALVLLACNLYIVYSQREKIVLFFRSLDFRSHFQLGALTRIAIAMGKITIIVLAVLLVYRNVSRTFFKGDDGLSYDRLVGVYSLDAVKKNGKPYSPSADSLLYKDLYVERQSRWNILRRQNGETDAFVLKLSQGGDSIRLYINKGGIGDGPDILDSATVVEGVYTLQGDNLTIHGVQLDDTLDLHYTRQDVKPKQWFW